MDGVEFEVARPESRRACHRTVRSFSRTVGIGARGIDDSSSTVYHSVMAKQTRRPTIKVEYGTDVTIGTFATVAILDEQQMRDLETELLAAVRRNEQNRLVLNFEHVEFMSSAFLGLLVKVHKRVIEMGGSLQLYNLDPRIYKIFEITNLTKVFDIVPPRP